MLLLQFVPGQNLESEVETFQGPNLAKACHALGRLLLGFQWHNPKGPKPKQISADLLLEAMPALERVCESKPKQIVSGF